jgi:hypothetical protein
VHEALKKAGVGVSSDTHRRGLYSAIAVGISYGNGKDEPAYLGTAYPEHAEQLLHDPDVQAMADFASGA